MESLEKVRDKFESLGFKEFKRMVKGLLHLFLHWKWLMFNGHYILHCVGKNCVQKGDFQSDQDKS